MNSEPEFFDDPDLDPHGGLRGFDADNHVIECPICRQPIVEGDRHQARRHRRPAVTTARDITMTLPAPVEPDIRVVGLDLSLTGSGLADSTGWVDLVGEQGVTNLPVSDQIFAIERLSQTIIERIGLGKNEITLAVVEALDNAQSYGGQTERAVLWWRVVEALTLAGVQTAMPTSAQVKIYAAGSGAATKTEIINAVQKYWPQFPVGRNHNKADAAAMVVLGHALLDRPLGWLPEQHTRVLPRIRYTTDPPSRVTRGG